MQILESPKRNFSFLNGRIKVQVLSTNPLCEETIGYYSNGQLHFKSYSGEHGFEGTGLSWYDNGVLCEESPYIKGKRQGILKQWHKNGALSYEGLYQNDLKEGIHRELYETGTNKSIKIYEADLLNGDYETCYDNGQVESEAYYVNGKMDGVYKRWFPHGKPALEVNFKMGLKSVSSKEWWENGQMRSSGTFDSGIKEGLFESWDETGLIIFRENFLKGRRHGKCEGRYRPNGVWEERFYIRNVMVPPDVYELIIKKKLTARDILGMFDAEVRKVCLEEFGYGRFLAQMEHKIIDKDGEQELVRINWLKREEPIYLVKVKCPSTDAFYTLRVPPTMRTVKEAVAWTFGLSPNEYHPEKET